MRKRMTMMVAVMVALFATAAYAAAIIGGTPQGTFSGSPTATT